MKYIIGDVTCDDDNHGHSISNVMVIIDHKKYEIKNYSDHKEDIDKLVCNGIYGGITCALFSLNDNVALYIPTDKIVFVSITH